MARRAPKFVCWKEYRTRKVGAKTLIRRFKKETYPAPEYTGFVDFEGFIFMCVLFTPDQLERKNLRKLRFVLREAFPMTITRDNAALIRAAEEKLKQSPPVSERASPLSRDWILVQEHGSAARCPTVS